MLEFGLNLGKAPRGDEIGKACNYIGCNFRLKEVTDAGIVLEPVGKGAKNIEPVTVPFSQKHLIKEGVYQSANNFSGSKKFH